MSDQWVSREEYDALVRRVAQLEENFDAHRTVIISGLQRVERKVDDIRVAMDERLDTVMETMDERLDTVMETMGEQGTLLRLIRHIGLPDDD